MGVGARRMFFTFMKFYKYNNNREYHRKQKKTWNRCQPFRMDVILWPYIALLQRQLDAFIGRPAQGWTISWEIYRRPST